MAVVINSSPAAHTPGYNPQLFVATSTNYNQTGFKYVVTVRIESTNVSPVIEYTEKYSPRPDNGKLYLDVQRLVDASINNEFFPSILDFQQSLNGAITSVTVGIDEEYGSPVSGFTGASGSYQAWNAAYTAHDFSSYSYSTSTSSKDLTLSPSLTDTISINQRYLFKTWHRGFGTRDLRYMLIESFDSSGVSIRSSLIENAYYSVSTYRRNLMQLNCSPYGLNNFSGSIVSQSTPGLIVPANTASYTFYLVDFTLQTASATNTVTIDTMCYKYDRYVLHFLNKLGNYDSFTFNFKNRKTAGKKTMEYKKNPFELVSNTLVYYNYKSDNRNFNTTVTNKMTLNSDWITDAEATWLKDLIMSPSVILEDLNGTTPYLYAVKVTDAEYESKQKVNDMVFNLTVNVEFEYQDIRQRG